MKSNSQTARHTLNSTVVDSHARASSYNAGADRASFSSTQGGASVPLVTFQAQQMTKSGAIKQKKNSLKNTQKGLTPSKYYSFLQNAFLLTFIYCFVAILNN